MIVLSTRIPLTKQCTRKVFLDGLYSYLVSNPSWEGIQYKEDVRMEKDFAGESETRRITISHDKNFILVTMAHLGESACTHNLLYRDNATNQPILSVQLEKNYEERLPIPPLVRNFMWKGYFDDDAGLETGDTAIQLTSKNMDTAEGILTGISPYGENYKLPTVYISIPKSGKHIFNYERLAYDLAGIAHVGVETNPFLSTVLQERLGEKKPYNGAININVYGNSFRIVVSNESEDYLISSIKKQLYKMVQQAGIPEDYDMGKVRLAMLTNRLKEHGELSVMFEEILKEKDQELLQYKNALEEERQAKKSQYISVYNTPQISTGNVELSCSEKEFYPGEFKDVLLKVIKDSLHTAEGDANLEERRRFHVLSTMLKENEQTGIAEQIMAHIERALDSDMNINKTDWSILKELGFTVESDSNHIVICYKNDQRYKFTLAKTGSDYREAKNIIKTIRRQLF